MLSDIVSWGSTLFCSAFLPVAVILFVLLLIKKITKKIFWTGIKIAVIVYLVVVFVLPAVSGCGRETDEIGGTETVEASETKTYASSVTKLGTYTGLSYTDSSTKTPTDDEVQEEMEAILLWFEDAELTDDWLAENMDYESVEAFREDTRANLTEVYQQEAWKDAATELFEAVIADSEFDLVQSDLDTVYARYEAVYQEYADMLELSLEDYVQSELEIDMDAFEQNGQEASEMVLKTELIASAIVEDQQLDVDASYERIAKQIVSEEGYDSVEDLEEAAGGRESLKTEIIYRLAAEFMMEHGTAVSE